MEPNRDAIRSDLTWMTRRWGELSEPVMFELRALAEHRQPQIAKFSIDWIDDAVEWAAAVNKAGMNVYAVRNPVKAGTSGSASDPDIAAAFFLWADCDDAQASENVRNLVGPKWTASVVTGTTPSTRVHVYFELTEPVYDLAVWYDMQARIAASLKSDPKVKNPSRVMRVGGTVAFPDKGKRERGYISEVSTIRTSYAEPRTPVTMDQMARAFAPQSLSQQATPTGAKFEIDTGETGQRLDREQKRIQALSGKDWHDAVVPLVGSYVAKGLTDSEIHALTDPLTLSGYTVEETRKEVQTAIDGARRKGWTPEPAYADPAAIAPKQREVSTPSSTPPSDFDAPPRQTPEIEWFDDVRPALTDAYLVKGVIGQESMSVVYGPSNSGKTFFAMDLAFHIAIGAVWRGLRVKQAAVLYIAAEGGRGVANRIAALQMTTGVVDVAFALRRGGMDLLKATADLQAVCDMAADVKTSYPGLPMFIVIDTLSRIMAGGDENNAADMTALIRNIDAIRAATGAHIMLVHHTGKDTARGARGHSSLRAATDTEIEVSNEDGARAAIVTKQRDYQGGETFAFDLKSVDLGHDQDGDMVTSCVVEPADGEEYSAARSAAKGRGKNQQIIMEAFDQMIAEGLAVGNSGGVGMPEPGRFWAVDTGELRRIAQGKMVGDNAAKLFRTAWDALTATDGVFVSGNNQVWRTDRKKNK